VRKVNTKHIQLGYEFKDVGPSGVAGVEVWYTRDTQEWRRVPGILRDNPCSVDLEEGTYGITLIARTGFGGGREAPTSGEQPQLWVEVDVTKPVVFLTGMQQGSGTRTLLVGWTARDDNFGGKPIGIYCAEQPTGPWLPITERLENSGSYLWQVPSNTPPSIYLRVEATDLAGNVSTADSPTPVLIDLSRPSVTNIRLATYDK
jgi:hypothetical protein